MPKDVAFVSVDDICVIGKSKKQHLENLVKVFEILKSKNMKLNMEKCYFFLTEVNYLGHRIT